MSPRSRLPALLSLASLVACVAAAGAATTPQPREGKHAPVYKWVDEKGVVHYGDAVPPQYADQDKTILNSQGVPVGSIPGRRTPEQAAAEAAQRKAEEHARDQAVLNRQRDTNLLATYLSVEEIESLRDRRAEILDAQARVTSQYLEQLRSHQKALEQQASRYRPYNTAPNAAQMPERLAEDLVHTATDIGTQQRNLEVKRQELEKLKAQFASDIARFKELKRIQTEYNAGGTTPRNN
ncbi:MAG: DUF4124 domain-containing protein [Proteobacteria bacterium]|nr:DUF4124 domain-containing protein [Pseudomonadota bacterium]